MSTLSSADYAARFPMHALLATKRREYDACMALMSWLVARNVYLCYDVSINGAQTHLPFSAPHQILALEMLGISVVEYDRERAVMDAMSRDAILDVNANPGGSDG